MRTNGLACLVVCVASALAGCAPQSAPESDAQVDLTFEPSPPAVGDAGVTLTLASATGEPITGADVRLEGNMNHAGMKPSFADLEEGEPGRYSGTLDFTMGGDWFILVTAKTKDGSTVEEKIDVLGVQRP